MKKITTLSFLCATALLAGSLAFALKENTQENNIVEVSATSHPGNYDEYTYSGSYYDGKVLSSDSEGMNGNLRKNLTSLIHPSSGTTPTYSGTSSGSLAQLCQSADEDPLNSNNMIYLYTRNSVTKNAAQSWNREHVWPKSLSNNCWTTSRAGSDLLHLRPTYEKTNGERSSKKYGEVSKSNAVVYNEITYGYSTSSTFMPLDSVKGDVARICMYIWVAYYDEYGSSHPALTKVFESFDTLLSWHTSDRPDVMEGHRNDFCQTSCNQHNRNPFVDHPEYAWKIFGSQCSTSVLNAARAAYPESGSSSGYVSISQSSASLTVDDTLNLSATSSDSSNITWTNSNNNAVSISADSTASGGSITVTALAEGTATITASATIDEVVKSRTCTITVSNSGGSGGGGQEESTYTMLTSFSDIDSTAQYVLGVEGTGFHYAGTSSWGSIALPSAQTPLFYTLTKGTNNNFTARTTINSTTYYLTVPTGSNTFTMSTTSTNIKLGTSTSDSNGHPSYAIANPTTTGRHLRINGASGLRSYEGTTGVMAYFYKVNQEEQEPTLDSISVSTAPTKTVYNEGEYFNPIGLVITASYSNGNQTISYSGHESDFDFDPDLETALDTTDTTISIYYGGISCEQAITVNEEVTLNSISISNPPTKTTYTEGESFDPTGLVITASYSNGNQTISYSGHASDFSFNPDLEAELDTSDTFITISYGGKSCNQPITVNEQVTLSSISVSGQTTKFTVGDTFVFGGTVTAHYSDSNTEDVTEDASFTGYDMSSTGNQTVTVTYNKVSTTYSITVSEAQQGDTDSVTIAQDHTFSPSLPASKATSNTTSTLHSDLTSGIAFREQSIYKDSNSKYIMFVENKGFLYNTDSLGTIDSISITYSSSTSTSGKIGVYFGSTERSTYTTSANVTIKGVSQTDVFENSTEGYGFFQISTSNKNVQIVTIVIEYHESGSSQQGDPVLTGITLDTTNVTKVFEVNDTFSYTGLVVTAHYDISTYDEVITNYTVDTPNMSTAGQKTVVVTYQGKTDSYEITVTSDAPTPVSGDGAVYNASAQGYTDKQDVTSIVIKQDCITGAFDISTGNNAPKYYDNGAAVRCYPGNMLTITSTKANIISITFTFGSNDTASNTIVPTSGTYLNGTWTNTSMQNQVIFNFGDASSGNRRIAGITVNYYNATSFASEFLDGTGCDSTGKTAPTVNWSSMSTKYSTMLFTEDQNTLKNASANESGTTIEQAIARYNYIVNKYGYNNFMNRSTSGSYNNFKMVNKEINFTALIVVISIISSISLIAFVTYKKKKKQ